MGFFKNILKSVNPVEQLKNPKKTFRTMAVASVDPGGTLIRTGRGVKQNLKNTFDPLNATLPAKAPKDTSYQDLLNQLRGPQNKGMWMGPKGDTIYLNNGPPPVPRNYAANPFYTGPMQQIPPMSSPKMPPAPMSFGGGAAPAAPGSSPPMGVAPPPSIPMVNALRMSAPKTPPIGYSL